MRRPLLLLAAAFAPMLAPMLAGCATSPVRAAGVAPAPGRVLRMAAEPEAGEQAARDAVRTLRATVRREGRSHFASRLPVRPSSSDPVGDAFTKLPSGLSLPPGHAVPGGGSLDLGRLGAATLYGRVWKHAGSYRGLGLGVSVPLRSSVAFAAEVAVDGVGGPETVTVFAGIRASF